jgi:hypothetical protein
MQSLCQAGKNFFYQSFRAFSLFGMILIPKEYSNFYIFFLILRIEFFPYRASPRQPWLLSAWHDYCPNPIFYFIIQIFFGANIFLFFFIFPPDIYFLAWIMP